MPLKMKINVILRPNVRANVAQTPFFCWLSKAKACGCQYRMDYSHSSREAESRFRYDIRDPSAIGCLQLFILFQCIVRPKMKETYYCVMASESPKETVVIIPCQVVTANFSHVLFKTWVDCLRIKAIIKKKSLLSPSRWSGDVGPIHLWQSTQSTYGNLLHTWQSFPEV